MNRLVAQQPRVIHRLTVIWRRAEVGVDFRKLALAHPTMEGAGVYVIHAGPHAHRLGQATRIRDRLRAHQRDEHVVGTTAEPLQVQWALVPRAYRDGVEAFLGHVLRPDVADRFPHADLIAVNLPTEVDNHEHGMQHSPLARKDEPWLACDQSRGPLQDAYDTLVRAHARSSNHTALDLPACTECQALLTLRVIRHRSSTWNGVA